MSRMERKRKRDSVVNIKRLSSIGIVSFVILTGLIIRLFYIQVIGHDFYTNQVLKQRQLSIPVDSGRGLILDRNFIPLTDRIEKRVAVVFPQDFILNESNISFLEEITGVEYETLFNKVKNTKYRLEFAVKDDLDRRDKRLINTRGLFIVDKKMRYEDNGLLTHVIGYINKVDLKGESGIEKVRDGLLSRNSGKTLAATLDGLNRFLPGEGYAVVNSSGKKEHLKLTVDYHIQKIVEDALDKNGKNGAAIVSDIRTGEILSMASRPNFNPNNIPYYTSGDNNTSGDELLNKATELSFPPGSIFKIVVAIETLIQNPEYLEGVFECKGYETVGNNEIKCVSYHNGGHGEITIDKAFADSCNSVFIQLAEKVGAQNIINRAKELGFNEIVGIGLKEESGNLPQGDNLLGPAYGNIGIGQGEILVSPLQINQLTQIIANSGLKKPLYIMEDTVDENYNTLIEPDVGEEEQVVDPDIVKRVQGWMEKVMVDGSGKKANELSNITAGKTGSAESTKDQVHAWFTGYYPTNDPKYAVTIFIEDGKSGGGVAVPIYREIAEKMMNIGYE